jgi:hypothetical protein
MSKPEELVKIVAGQLVLDGWNRDQLGNTLTNTKYPDSKIVLTYSGSQVQIIGRHGDKSITKYVDNSYNALVNVGMVLDFFKDSHVSLP